MVPEASASVKPWMQADSAHNAEGVDLGDLNGDGYLDAFFADAVRSEIWLNDGNGAFVDSGSSLSTDGEDVVLGDVDSDGDIDALILGQDKWDVNTTRIPSGHAHDLA